MPYCQTKDNLVLIERESQMPLCFSAKVLTTVDNKKSSLFDFLFEPIDIPDKYHTLIEYSNYATHYAKQLPEYSTEFLEQLPEKFFAYYDGIVAYNKCIDSIEDGDYPIDTLRVNMWDVNDNNIINKLISDYNDYAEFGAVNERRSEVVMHNISAKDIRLFLPKIVISPEIERMRDFLLQKDYLNQLVADVSDANINYQEQLLKPVASYVVFYSDGEFLGADNNNFKGSYNIANARMFESADKALSALDADRDYTILEIACNFKAVHQSNCTSTTNFIESTIEKDKLNTISATVKPRKNKL